MSVFSFLKPRDDDDLIADLAAHVPYDKAEATHIRQTLEFLESDPNPFDRANMAGHVTGSAWLVSPDLQYVLLTHHAILDLWLQFGGHADGNPDILDVAIREAEEESGITGITPLQHHIFDVDVHPIPANPRRREGAHIHYDIRYILRAPHMGFAISPESKALKWISIHEIFRWPLYPSMHRMATKWQRLL
jgi:8-oxo-dGTP pyrophosphatase MutT (NUDIX family)